MNNFSILIGIGSFFAGLLIAFWLKSIIASRKVKAAEGEAARYFERALELEPEFADGHVALGIAYAVEAKVYPALDHLELAAQLEPENFYAHFKLGQLFFKLRVPQRGYEAMQRALGCATTLAERRLVAGLLREEKQREKGSYRRPWWNKPFSQLALLVGASLMVMLIAALFASIH